MTQHCLLVVMILLGGGSLVSAETPTKPLKVFILAGQSNMVGWGDSRQLNDNLCNGNGKLTVPEYLRVWGRWARTGRQVQAAGF